MGGYPVLLKLKGKRALVIGGGKVACRKTSSLLESGAEVTVIATEADDELKSLDDKGLIELRLRPYTEGDEKGFFLVFAATGDHAVNSVIAKRCDESNVLLNAVDDPPNCDFFIPAKLERGDVTIAVSTNGKSPMLAARIRDEISGIITEEYGKVADILGDVRDRVNASNLPEEERKKKYGELLDGDIIAEIRNTSEDAVRERVNQWISSWLD